jgi:hypothetical protein
MSDEADKQSLGGGEDGEAYEDDRLLCDPGRPEAELYQSILKFPLESIFPRLLYTITWLGPGRPTSSPKVKRELRNLVSYCRSVTKLVRL